jgi:ADP-ribose pyrophosphatase YjhB (NUDIX family)
VAKKLTPKEFKKVYLKVPRLTVEVIIKTPEGVVLSKRDIEPYNGMWHIPGGTVLMGEKLEDAVRRIAEEETGLRVEINNYVGVIYYYHIGKEHGWPIGLAYLTYVVGGKINEKEGSSEIKVFKEIPKGVIESQVKILKKIF